MSVAICEISNKIKIDPANGHCPWNLLFVQIGSILQSETLNLTTVWLSNVVPAEIVDLLIFFHILCWIYQLLSLFPPGQHCLATRYKLLPIWTNFKFLGQSLFCSSTWNNFATPFDRPWHCEKIRNCLLWNIFLKVAMKHIVVT